MDILIQQVHLPMQLAYSNKLWHGLHQRWLLPGAVSSHVPGTTAV